MITPVCWRSDRIVLALLCSLGGGACGSEESPVAPVTLQGTVTDAPTGRALYAAQVHVNGDSVGVDTLGAFHVTLDPGMVELTVSADPYYEPVVDTFELGGDTAMAIHPVRWGSWIESFTVNGNAISGVIRDAHDTGTLYRDENTWLVYHGPPMGQSGAYQAQSWTWTPIDLHRWSFAMTTNADTINSFGILISNHSYGTYFDCYPATGTCIESPPTPGLARGGAEMP